MSYLERLLSQLKEQKSKLEFDLVDNKSELLLWQERVKISTKKERFDLFQEASFKANVLEAKSINLQESIDEMSSKIEEVSYAIKVLRGFDVNYVDSIDNNISLDVINEEINLIKQYLTSATISLNQLELKVSQLTKDKVVLYDESDIEIEISEELEYIKKELKITDENKE